MHDSSSVKSDEQKKFDVFSRFVLFFLKVKD